MKKKKIKLLFAFGFFTAFFFLIFGITGLIIASQSNDKFPLDNIQNITWTFGRADGSIISEKMKFAKNSRLKYFSSYNEVFWEVADKNLILTNGNRQPTTVFDNIYKNDGVWVMEGKFLLDTKIVHTLTETERDNKKLYYIFIALSIIVSSAMFYLLRLNFSAKVNIFLQVIFLFLFTLNLFIFTVELRSPYNNRTNEWLTGATIKFTNMWIRENPFKLGFGMFFNPASVEFQDLKSREVYSSYPPGTIIPLYFLGLFKGGIDSSIVIFYNLLNHFFISFIMGLTIFFFLLKSGFNLLKSFLSSTIPVIYYLLSPVTLYLHHIIYFSDMAIILPFVFYILLEVLRDYEDKLIKKITNIISPIVLFYGIFTDYFFVFVATAVYFKRLLFLEFGKKPSVILKKSILHALPAVAAIVIFILQTIALGGVKRLADIFLFRTGLDKNEAADNFFDKFWMGHFKNAYSEMLLYLLWFCLAVFAVLSVYYLASFIFKKKNIPIKIKKILALIGIVIVPCFLQVYFLKNHSTIHFFPILKFAVPLGMVGFILIWILLYFSLKGEEIDRNKNNFSLFYPVFLVFFVFSMVFINTNYNKFKRFYPAYYDFNIEKFIKANCDYNDVVFSTSLSITPDPPQFIAVSEKRVYRINCLYEINNKLSNIDSDYYVNLITKTNENLPPDLKSFCDNSDSKLNYKEFTLHKMSKKKFLELF